MPCTMRPCETRKLPRTLIAAKTGGARLGAQLTKRAHELGLEIGPLLNLLEHPYANQQLIGLSVNDDITTGFWVGSDSGVTDSGVRSMI